MKILIVSYESWRDTNNGGNVLSNIFCAMPDAEIAQIYCSGETPQNSVCRKYFRISDTMLLRRPGGRALEERDYGSDGGDQSDVAENRIKSRIPGALRHASLFARELRWTVFDWRTPQLDSFIADFAPDVIFAPCYSFYHVSKLALYVKKVAGCPMISYISDDNYSLKQFYFSPSFWINRIITRKWIRRLFDECSLIYTMTRAQLVEYEAIFHRPMKILCKSASFDEQKSAVGDPIRFIYAGGLYLNRWRVLAELAKAFGEINADGVRMRLDIFSGTKLSAGKMKRLADGRNSVFCGQIPYGELVEEYNKADVAILVEAFDLRNRLATRLSFSTKIIDCLNSGCAILAIGPDSQAGLSYLRENDAAICVGSIGDLPSAVKMISEHPELIPEYSRKAAGLGKKNHMKDDIERMIRQDFIDVVNNAPIPDPGSDPDRRDSI